MRKRLVDEIKRSDLLPQTTHFIQAACEFYRNDPYFQQDKTAETTAILGQAYYNVPSGYVEMRQFLAVDAGQKYIVYERTFETLLALDSNVTAPTTGAPVYWAPFESQPASQAAPDTNPAVGEDQVGGDQIRIFPRPDFAYPLQFDFIYAIPAPVNDSDTSFWTTDAKEMIRSMAKYLLRMELNYQPALAAQDKAIADMYFSKLKQGFGMRKLTGRIASHW